MIRKIYLTITIILCCFEKCSSFYGILMVILPYSSVVCLFSRQKLCVFISVVPFQLVKIAYWFSFKCVVQWRPENILRKRFCFFFTLEKIKYRSNLVASSDFAVTSRRMIIYTAIQTFSIAINFICNIYHSLFWFLLTILSILSLTAQCPRLFKCPHFLLIFPMCWSPPIILMTLSSLRYGQTEICADIWEEFERIYIRVNAYHKNKTTNKIKLQPNRPLRHAF